MTTSLFETSLEWAAAQQRGRALLNRLAAIAAQVELLQESAAIRQAQPVVGDALETLRADLTEAARGARGLLEALSAHAPAPASAELGLAVRDTLGPLRRYL